MGNCCESFSSNKQVQSVVTHMEVRGIVHTGMGNINEGLVRGKLTSLKNYNGVVQVVNN